MTQPTETAGDNHKGPIGGTPESAAFFRDALAEIGETQGGLAKLMKRCGDDRAQGNILRSIQRMASGDARVSGEMRVILHFLRASRRKRLAAQKAADAEPIEENGWLKKRRDGRLKRQSGKGIFRCHASQ